MEAQHLGVVHLVDVVAGEHDEMSRVLAQDRIEVLVDRIGGAEIPVLADALLRAENLDELAEFVGDDAPSHAEVPAERQRLVLERDEDLPQPGVDAVAQREVDDAVGAAEVDRRLGAFLRQRIQPFADAAGQHHDHYIVQHGIFLPLSPNASERHGRARRRCPGFSAAGNTSRTSPLRLPRDSALR